MASRSSVPKPPAVRPRGWSRLALPRLLPSVIVVLGLAAALRVAGVAQQVVAAMPERTSKLARTVEPSAALIAIAPAAGAEKEEKGAKADKGSKAAPPAAPAPAPEAPPRPSGDEGAGMTPAEMGVLQELAQRRAAIDKRARELGEREAMLQAAEKQIEKKVEELKQLKAAVEATLKQQGEEEDGRKKGLVKIFEGMKPAEAARIFEQMDLPQLVEIIERMKDRNASAIMAQLHPVRAKQVAGELAKRRPAVPGAPAAPPRQG
ncbi:MAG: hypothetical protein JNK67_02855 [Alphaproteobacteria bacterium]|nr:hypothetical protein [Alphaproteobacteria bacterium]